MNAWWLALLLQAQTPEESLEMRLSQRAQLGETSLIQAYGEIIATARSCRFPETEIERLEREMKAQQIARAAAASESFDTTEYAGAFQAGVSAMRQRLAATQPQTTPEMQAEACRSARIDFDSMQQIYRTDYDESPIAASAEDGPTQNTGSAAEQSDRDFYQQAKVDGTQLAQANYCDLLKQKGTALAIAFVNRAGRSAQRSGVALDQKMYQEGMEAGFRSTAELMRLLNSQYESQPHSSREDQERKDRYDEDCREIRQELDEVLAADAAATTVGR
jgi:hypothetical protein